MADACGWCWRRTTPRSCASCRRCSPPLAIELVAQARARHRRGRRAAPDLRRERAGQGAARGARQRLRGARRRLRAVRRCARRRAGRGLGALRDGGSARRRARGAAPRAGRRQQRAAAAATARRDDAARALRLHAGRAAQRRRPAAADRQSAAGTARSLRAPRGSGGFGYDPLMFIPPLGATRGRARCGDEERAQPPRAAARQMLQLMRDALALSGVRRRSHASPAPGHAAAGALPPLSLYVHLPWCLKKCPYCDFNSHELTRRACPRRDYLDALRADLEAALPLVWGRPRRTASSSAAARRACSRRRRIDRLLADIRARLPLSPTARSRSKPTPAPSSASASAPFATPA